MKSLAALVVLAALPLAACSSSPDRTGRATQGFYVPSYETLWERVGIEMRESGYPPDPDASNKAGRVVVSRWDTVMMPFTGKGTREQATVTMHPVPGKDNYWSVEANVLREQNMNSKDPTNPRKADWKNPTRVPEAESQLVHRIETFFVGYELSPEFRNRYGLGAGRESVPGYVNPDSPEGRAAADAAEKAKHAK